MAEVELPSLNFARYVDLLRRRKWQFVPIAVTGLIVGAVVAMMIPRYYEGQTTVRLLETVLDPSKIRAVEDNFKQTLDVAQNLIRDAEFVARAVEELAADLASDPDREAARRWNPFFPVRTSGGQINAEVMRAAGRVSFGDWNPARGRQYALVYIAYSDRDPVRAAQLANKLRELYFAEEEKNVLDRAKNELKEANDNRATAEAAREQCERALRTFEGLNDLIPVEPTSTKSRDSDPSALLHTDWSTAHAKVVDLEAQIEGHEQMIAGTEAQIKAGEIPQTVDTDVPITDPAIVTGLKEFDFRIEHFDRVLMTLKEGGGPYYELHVKLRDRAVKQREEWLARVGIKPDSQHENPRYAKAQQDIAERKTKVKELRGQLAKYQADEVKLKGRLERNPDVIAEHRLKTKNVIDADKEADRAREEYDAKAREFSRLKNARICFTQSYATPANEATYPNLILVALAGAAAGIAAAIALVIAIDFLSSSFKAVDDVGRVLKLPVLGMSAHIETEMERAFARRKRTTAGIAIAATVLILAGLVVIYRIDSTKLPVWVQNAVRSALGGR